jgi:glycosyltransferase involved in cell wall biosynthesis
MPLLGRHTNFPDNQKETMTTENLELTILMPCLNEAETVVTCIEKALNFLSRAGVRGEVLIADNGSTDGSQQLAADAGACVALIPERGYGAALLGGIAAAKGRYVIMADADDSYDFSKLEAFVEKLRAGHPLVMGNRFAGGIMPGAMPPLHRYLGNPVLSFIGRLLFRSPLGDFHCGLRGFDRAAILKLRLASPGMEFASEMIVKATLAGYNIAEVPTILRPDGRSRPPHLRSWRDGWRHLRFLLMMSPRWLLLYPGLSLFGLGIMLSALIFFRPIDLGGIGLDIHTMLYAAGASILGLQLMLFALLTRGVGVLKGVLPSTPAYSGFLRVFSLEKGIILGLGIFLAGLGFAGYSVALWSNSGLATLEPRQIMRIVIPSVTLLVAGAEIVFASFILSFMDPLSSVNPRPTDHATNEGKHQT